MSPSCVGTCITDALVVASSRMSEIVESPTGARIEIEPRFGPLFLAPPPATDIPASAYLADSVEGSAFQHVSCRSLVAPRERPS